MKHSVSAAIILAAGLFWSAQGLAPDVLPSDSAVRIEIFEKIPDEPSWDFTTSVPVETYSEPAFGLVAMPTRYSAQGIKVDRAKPFLLRATAGITLPKGEHQILLRARTGSRLFIDGNELVSTPFPDFKADGHEEVPQIPKALVPNIRYLRPGHSEGVATVIADGLVHQFKLEALIALKDRRPETGELSVSTRRAGGESFTLLSPDPACRVSLTEEGLDTYIEERTAFWRAHDSRTRRSLSGAESKYWDHRHQIARELSLQHTPRSGTESIDHYIEAKLETAKVQPAPLTDDYAFLRRVTLDTIGLIPAAEQAAAFARDSSPDKRSHIIDQLLSNPSWADHWVSYWQDVLAENPGILKPMLNNTGPFRWWIYESFADNKPMDRFATELITMSGSLYYGGPAGFSMATDNDVPMAQKAQIVAQAFLGMQLQCARCHDAPYHPFKQKDLFSLAAMLKRAPQLVPWSSSIPTNSHITIGRKVKVTLAPGSNVAPAWPFSSLLSERDLPDGVVRDPADTRQQLAALVTSPNNERFAKVLVNRLWKRYLGWGIVEPVDDWDDPKPSHPELLDYLARELTAHNYDFKHVARLILNSQTYQRALRPDGSEDKSAAQRLFAAPAHRRLEAEQLVDSLFFAAGKNFGSEELNLDIDGRRPAREFNNLGTPIRAWQFTSLSNERDRPALSLPRAQPIVDTLTAFGWRESRQNAVTVRDESANAIQPATIANGILAHGRISRLSDESAFTEVVLQELPLSDLIDQLFLRLLSRPPSATELSTFREYLAPGFKDRRNPEFARAQPHPLSPVRAVSWANHLNPEATRIKQDQERAARQGDPPTARLRPEWRQRAEDVIWALINSPEFMFVP